MQIASAGAKTYGSAIRAIRVWKTMVDQDWMTYNKLPTFRTDERPQEPDYHEDCVYCCFCGQAKFHDYLSRWNVDDKKFNRHNWCCNACRAAHQLLREQVKFHDIYKYICKLYYYFKISSYIGVTSNHNNR